MNPAGAVRGWAHHIHSITLAAHDKMAGFSAAGCRFYFSFSEISIEALRYE
jgi:hypothetical protein